MVQVRLVNANGSLSEDVTVKSPAVTSTSMPTGTTDTVIITGTIDPTTDGIGEQ